MVTDISLSTILGLLTEAGPFVVVLVLWWIDTRNMRKLIDAYRDDTREILGQMDRNMAEIRRQYDNNVDLVRNYDRHCERQEKTAEELSRILQMNTTAVTRLTDYLTGPTAGPRG